MKVRGEKKLHKFCRIMLWVEAEEPELAQVIRQLCLEGALAAGKGSPGVTFALPTRELSATIVDKAYSSEPEEALRLLDAHIIPQCLATAEQWQAAGAVGNRLGVLLGPATVDDQGGLKIKEARLAPADDFVPLKKTNIAAWRVTEGRLPTEGVPAPRASRPPLKPPARKRRAGGSVYGGAAPGSAAGPCPQRRAIARRVEAQYLEYLKDPAGRVDPYLDQVVSLLSWLKNTQREVFEAVVPLLDRDPVTSFYLFLEPHKQMGGEVPYLLTDVFDGPHPWIPGEGYADVGEFEPMIAEAAAAGKAYLCYGQPEKLRVAIDECRVAITGPDGCKANALMTPQKIESAYLALHGTNKISAAGPVFPEKTLELLHAPLRKLWQDELRMFIHTEMAQARADRSPQVFQKLVLDLETLAPGDNYEKELVYGDAASVRDHVVSQYSSQNLVHWVCSTDFLYFVVPREIVDTRWEGIPLAEHPLATDDFSVRNVEPSKIDAMAHGGTVVGRGPERCCHPDSREAIRKSVRETGQLPGDLGIQVEEGKLVLVGS